MLALNPDSGADTGFSLSVLQDVALNPTAPTGTTELYTVTAFDPAGASLMLGAPAVVQVQGLRGPRCSPPSRRSHADWDWNLTQSRHRCQGRRS